MLKRQLIRHLRHSGKLQRHLAARQVTARQVYATTPVPFLKRIGMVSDALAHRQQEQPSITRDDAEFATELDVVENELFGSGAGQTALARDRVTAAEDGDIAVVEASARPRTEPAEVIPSPADHQPPKSDITRVREELPAVSASESSPLIPRNQASPGRVTREPSGQPAFSRMYPGRAVVVPSPRPASTLGSNSLVAGSSGEREESMNGEESARSANTHFPAISLPPTEIDAIAQVESRVEPSPARSPIEPASEFDSHEARNLPEQAPEFSLSHPLPDNQPRQPRAIPIAARLPLPAANRQGSMRRAQIQEVTGEFKAAPAVTPRLRPRHQPEAGDRVSQAEPVSGLQKGPVTLAEPQEIFSPREDVDRSPTAWREKLAQALLAENEAKDAQPRVPATPSNARAEKSRPIAPRNALQPASATRRQFRDQSVRLPESSRRFLSPRMGFDARDVPVYQGPATSRVLAASGADAMTVEDSILLGPDYETGSPKTLAIVAHELTHVNRGREASFIPAVAREGMAHNLKPSVPDVMNEEKLAEELEGQVQQAAKAATHHTPELRSLTEVGSQIGDSTAPAFVRNVRTAEASSGTPVPDPWGGLPAPWEPMPELVAALPDAAHPHGPASGVVAPTVASTSGTAGADAASASVATAARAEIGRSVPEEEIPAAPAPKEHADPARQVGPDLDTLARQVYTIMRRRLAADRRRELMH